MPVSGLVPDVSVSVKVSCVLPRERVVVVSPRSAAHVVTPWISSKVKLEPSVSFLHVVEKQEIVEIADGFNLLC